MIGPHRKDSIPKHSEYKAQFQPWNHVAKSMAALPDAEFTPREKHKLTRSKSAEGNCVGSFLQLEVELFPKTEDK